ncbi:MAG: DUF2975 domain-containing protein [Anaerolineae bacterium]|uniref:DUF2975 domain-containing protein n=1 Tax=Promineifilum sp. TaxID=2664178 RepID=UPI001D906FE1|nr:DUF2975 domain-containing protein [Anaerolineales bacterium]MCB8933944.1 DUF2975 domain-containing protein [Promineifilum sp.]MCO5179345.1 DUF2975 domain-containing protein [Promineifilum sp.]MCW5845941.1 DUF2975 domain-containing protein [Anaerolineae bacterium]
MKKSSTLFLKVVILLIATGVLAGLIWFPQTEGRAANLDLVNIYTDPFIIFIYIGSIPFFVGLYQAFKLLNFIDANRAFSQGAVNILKNIKLAFLSLVGFIAAALFYIRFFVHEDDAAGPTGLGIFIALACGAFAVTAGIFQKLFQTAVDLKSENDLTV